MKADSFAKCLPLLPPYKEVPPRLRSLSTEISRLGCGVAEGLNSGRADTRGPA